MNGRGNVFLERRTRCAKQTTKNSVRHNLCIYPVTQIGKNGLQKNAETLSPNSNPNGTTSRAKEVDIAPAATLWCCTLPVEQTNENSHSVYPVIDHVASAGTLMREIVIDTETTGLDPLDGHRIVEIRAVELINRSPTGQTFHGYLCPKRTMPADALVVHGLTAEFLADRCLVPWPTSS